MWKIIAGERYDYGNEKLRKLMKMLDGFLKIARTLQDSPLVLFPILKYIPPFNREYTSTSKNMQEIREFLRAIIKEHKETFNKDNIRDYIDTFISEIQTSSNENFTEENLLITCLDMFVGGSETTSKSLMFFIAYIVLYPEIQEKIYQEVFAASSSENVRIDDLKNLLFTPSFIKEVWRLNSVVPMDVPRVATSNTKIGGFDIPAGAEIWSNYFAANTDEKVWKDSKKFIPERHIGQQDNLLTFGIGRRRCLGESLVRVENQLIFCNLVKHFKFEYG